MYIHTDILLLEGDDSPSGTSRYVSWIRNDGQSRPQVRLDPVRDQRTWNRDSSYSSIMIINRVFRNKLRVYFIIRGQWTENILEFLITSNTNSYFPVYSEFIS